MPQLNQLLLVYQSQWFWLAIVLAVLYFGIGRGMVPSIEKVVDDRNARIQGDLAAASAARASADALDERMRAADLDARSQAQGVIAKAKAEAAAQTEAALAKADAGLSERMGVAEANLAKARSEAMASLEGMASEAVREIVAKVSGATVAEDKAAAAVKTVLANG